VTEAWTLDPRPAQRLRTALERIADRTRGRTRTGVTHDTADATIGTIASDDAIGFDPLPLLRTLSTFGAPVVVIGQVAGILHGSTELTGDLDLLWSGDERDAAAMAAAFDAAGAELLTDGGDPIGAEAAFALPKTVFRCRSAAGDCCTPRLPWGIDVSPFAARARSTEIDSISIRYLAVDDLIAMRRVSARLKDLRRIAELERLARAGGRGGAGDE
jgi:hypothetical protein